MNLPINQVLSAAAHTYRRMGAHALTGAPIAVVWTACFAGAFYVSGQLDGVLATALTFLGVLVLVVWQAGTLRAMTSGAATFRLGGEEIKYVIATVLYSIILAFGAVIILFPVIMATMALWALVSFEFEGPEMSQEEFIASFEAFQAHPLFALCVLVLIAGLCAIAALAMRGSGYAAACISKRRVVAMEAFNWTRGNNLFLLALGLTVALPVILLIGPIGYAASMMQSEATAARLLSAFLTALVIWPVSLAALSLSCEVFARFPEPQRDTSQPGGL